LRAKHTVAELNTSGQSRGGVRHKRESIIFWILEHGAFHVQEARFDVKRQNI
jgi:hypothetical protein